MFPTLESGDIARLKRFGETQAFFRRHAHR